MGFGEVLFNYFVPFITDPNGFGLFEFLVLEKQNNVIAARSVIDPVIKLPSHQAPINRGSAGVKDESTK